MSARETTSSPPTRLGGAGGQTGTVLNPVITYETDRMVIRTDVASLADVSDHLTTDRPCAHDRVGTRDPLGQEHR